MDITEKLAARRAREEQQALEVRQRAQATYWAAVAAAADRPEAEATDAELAHLEAAIAALGIDEARLRRDIEELLDLRRIAVEHNVDAARQHLAAVRQVNSERAERVVALRAEIEALEKAVAVEGMAARSRVETAEEQTREARRRAVLLVDRGCAVADVVAMVPTPVVEPMIRVRALRSCVIQGQDRQRGEVFDHYGQPASIGRYVELVVEGATEAAQDDAPAARALVEVQG